MFLFGAILAEIYAKSGAAISISQTISSRIFTNQQNTRKNFARAFLAVILASAVLCYGGINSGVAIVTIYPIALGIFAAADIPKKYIMGAICGGAFTFALSGPGSPQLTNIAGMELGTRSTSGLVAGITAIIVEIVIMVFLLSRMATRARLQGEHFAYGPNDTIVEVSTARPGFFCSLIPLIFLLVTFNVFKFNIIIATMLSCAVAIVLFFKQLTIDDVKGSLSNGASSALIPCGCMGSVVGFATVVQSTDAFQNIIKYLTSLPIPAVLLLVVSVAFICALTGGSTTGFRIALPIISKNLMAKGLSASLIHRVGAFSSTTIDSLPHSGAVIMAMSLADLKMKNAYPAVFATTTIATIGGTAVAAIIMLLFPWLP
ncbi:MAG: GntP family permease [Ruminococcus sp.]|nr:GntP family permease [Ruminococcus sp.]